MTQRLPKTPESALKRSGTALWSSVTGDYELEVHEQKLLLEACRTLDLLDALADDIDRNGAIVDGKANPAAVEARQQRIALARLIAALRLPAGEDGDHQAAARPQRRVGARGVYSIGGTAS